MLVLSRREGEKIMIGDSITVTIVRLGGDKIRVGIDAPDNVLILRGELEAFQEQQNAANSSVTLCPQETCQLAKPAA